MALLHSISAFQHLQRGFRNRDLRQHVANLQELPSQDRPGRMTYDLRRLRLKGLIARVANSNLYVVTSYGLRVALFFTKLYLRILRPAWAALTEPPDSFPRPLRRAFESLDDQIRQICLYARLQPETQKLDSFVMKLLIEEV